jgi:DNA invertase Pin-like site-specific DNA recombinase
VKPLAYSYLRFSHPEQARGDTVRRQKELRDRWLVAHPGVRLDTSLTMADKGVSAFKGEHRENPDRHALAAFVALVKAGRIPRGSYLLVENLDRLSREHIQPALQLFLDLTQSGIRIVQLSPVETVFDDKSDLLPLLAAVFELSRGHGESVLKSERIGKAWREKKKAAAADGTPVTSEGPAWLTMADGRWQLNRKAAAVIRRIYRLATDGHGTMVIAKRLNAEGVPVISRRLDARGEVRRGKKWTRAYVANLLTARTVVGEYQPHAGRGARRRPDGPPVPNYYPPVVTEAEWQAARAALASRRRRGGRLPRGVVNVFSGLLRDARDGAAVHVKDESLRGGRTRKVLVSAAALDGQPGSRFVTFPFAVFTDAVLSCLREIDPRTVLPANGHQDRVLTLTDRLAGVEAEVEKVKGRLLEKGYSDALADVLGRLEAKHKQLAGELASARQEAASPLGAAWGDCKSLLDALDHAPNPADAQVKLRAAVRRITESVWCLFVGRGRLRVAAVQLWFQGGQRRDYLVVSRAGMANGHTRREARWWVRSAADVVGTAPLDLRKRQDARDLEKALLEAGLELGHESA